MRKCQLTMPILNCPREMTAIVKQEVTTMTAMMTRLMDNKKDQLSKTGKISNANNGIDDCMCIILGF